MAPEGSPRDMNEWRATLRDPNITFPGESSEYRRARNELLEAEDELRRLNADVAAKRRALSALAQRDKSLSVSCRRGKIRQVIRGKEQHDRHH
jgi:predicted dithiol-disulfide oxidoreductase (DUF899 family)